MRVVSNLGGEVTRCKLTTSLTLIGFVKVYIDLSFLGLQRRRGSKTVAENQSCA